MQRGNRDWLRPKGITHELPLGATSKPTAGYFFPSVSDGDAPSHRSVDGLNNSASVTSATRATGTAYVHCCEPMPMYHATGSSSSCAKTAMPRPQRRPVHSAQPAASTPAPMITNHPAVPYPLSHG